MQYRRLGKTGIDISEISLGTWQVGGTWGSQFDPKGAEDILNTAIDNGINFIDTADVYESGLSEKAVGKIIRSRKENIYIATKCGRQINPHTNEGYTPKVLRKYVEDSLVNTGLDRLDLIQLHCPPTEVYYRPEIFGEFEKLKQEGKIAHLGVSVEKVEEGIKAIEYDNVCSVQIIFNIFRQRPNELFLQRAQEKDVGVIARVPLASGLLTGQYTIDKTFEKGDHRFFNRNGEAFDKGETFSGIPYSEGVKMSKSLKSHFEPIALHHIALQWILHHGEITTVIPGASKKEQVLDNLKALAMKHLHQDQIDFLQHYYITHIKPLVHHLW